MSRAKLLRQYLTDYNKEVGKADDIYKEQYGTYKAKAEEYNAFVNSVKAGQQNAVGEFAPGAYTLLKGYTDSNGQPSLTAYSADKQGNPQMAGSIYDKLPETLQWGNGAWLKNSDGTATFHTWSSGPGMMGGVLEGVTPGWQSSGNTARIMDNSGIVAPTQNEPKAPTFTVNQLQEMANPTDDAAGMVKANALGYTGNPRLTADQPTSRNSAFSNLVGDDPNNLKDKGVLARAIAGEI